LPPPPASDRGLFSALLMPLIPGARGQMPPCPPRYASAC